MSPKFKKLLLSVFITLVFVLGKFPPGDAGIPDGGRSMIGNDAHQLG